MRLNAWILLLLGVCAATLTGPATWSEVLFYASFDGTRDAQAVGDGQATLIAGGGALTADGFGIRGAALRSGDEVGYLEFSAAGNILPEEGTIEVWMKPEDWSSDDGYYHQYIDVIGEGNIRFQKRADTVNVFWVKAPKVPPPGHFDDKYPGITMRGYACQQIKDKWRQFFLIWRVGEPLRYYRGGPEGKGVHDSSNPAEPPAPPPGKLTAIRIGDFGGAEGRQAHTLIDEVYIYDRALTFEEAWWANVHAKDRQPGTDIPTTFAEPTAKVVPDPANKTLVVEIDSGDRSGDFAGQAHLEPAVGTEPAPIVQTEGRFGEARIAYDNLPQGDYEVIAELTTKDGQPRATVKAKLVVPGPPVWLTEKVGVSDTPPPPWTPVQVAGNNVSVWGRQYTMGAFGLPEKIVNQGRSILAGPVTLRCVQDGKEVAWNDTTGSVSSKTAAKVVRAGTSTSTLGKMTWRAAAEFDGFMLYDFELTPAAEAEAELMELRVPIRKQYATLIYKSYSTRGLLAEGEGVLWKSGYGRYWWLGTDDFGLCGATEHAGAMINRADDAFSIVREANGDISVVYRFLGERQKITEPWKLRWILMATPTKPLPKDWRTWRDLCRSPDKSDAPDNGRLCVASPWPHEAKFKYFSFPVLKSTDWYRGYVQAKHEEGTKVLPYSLFVTMPPEMPECAFYRREWANPLMGLADLSRPLSYEAVRAVPSWIDFMVWKHRELVKEYGHDGLYVDFAGVYGTVFAPEYGLGYVRDGKEYPTLFPVCAVREIWKRVYTMFKGFNPDSVIVGHDSQAVHAPILSFCDVWLNGEHNWRGPLRDNYLEVLPLDQLRAAFRAQAHGGIPWFLPQWYGAILEDEDVVKFQANGKPSQVTIEKSHHLFGLGLLHDFGFWPICGMNSEATEQYYGVLNEFGIDDAKFYGYWDNAWLIGGQTDAIKASAYRKPDGGGLVVIYNVTREAQTPTLRINWSRLQGEQPLTVVDAYTKEPVTPAGPNITVEVPPLNYRLLWVK